MLRTASPGSPFALLLTFLVLLPCGAGAQESRARAAGEVSLRPTRLHGKSAVLGGGGGLLTVGGTVSFGGAGYVLFQPIDLSAPGSDLELHLAYGGLLAQVRLCRPGRLSCSVRALLGAGNAKVVVPVSGTELDADNFGLVEPEIFVALRIRDPLFLRLGTAYRFVYGVEDLPRVTPDDLRGASLSVTLSLGRF